MRHPGEPTIRDILGYVAQEIRNAASGDSLAVMAQREKRQAALLRMLQSDQPPVQWVAIRELGQMGDREAAAALVPLTTSANGDLRKAAREALQQIERREGVEQSLAPPAPPPVVPPVHAPPPPPAAPERAKPGMGATRVRLDMPPAIETEREVRARRSDATLSSERQAQQVGPSGAAPVPVAAGPTEQERTAGDDLLPMLINRVQGILPVPAQAATTVAAIPPLAAMETSLPAIPEPADLPPA